ncbi:MAG: hypothetical protein ACOYL8_03740, partial [Patescibacteria group bacterium]
DEPLTGYKQLKNNGTDLRAVFWNTTNNATSITTSTPGTCIINSSSNDYFIPTRTINEWNAFVGNKPAGVSLAGCCGDKNCSAAGGENVTNCATDCGGVCEPMPLSIYTAAYYWIARSSDQANIPADLAPYCPTDTNGYSIDSTSNYFRTYNVGNTLVNDYRMCGSLIRPQQSWNPQICSGDKCTKGIKYSNSNILYNSYVTRVDICEGIYDASLNICVYNDTPVSDYNQGDYVYPALSMSGSPIAGSVFRFAAGGPSFLPADYESAPIWGLCSNCGDGVCDAGRNEGCGGSKYCEGDCGSCSCTSNANCTSPKTCVITGGQCSISSGSYTYSSSCAPYTNTSSGYCVSHTSPQCYWIANTTGTCQ